MRIARRIAECMRQRYEADGSVENGEIRFDRARAAASGSTTDDPIRAPGVVNGGARGIPKGGRDPPRGWSKAFPSNSKSVQQRRLAFDRHRALFLLEGLIDVGGRLVLELEDAERGEALALAIGEQAEALHVGDDLGEEAAAELAGPAASPC